MAQPVSYFGIRHHGPGSAAALVAALDELRPACVLIEGPSDASDVLGLLASDGMVPPVALLAYPADDPSLTAFWPFAEYSPEYQATCWAVRNGVPVQFIDLPSTAVFEEQARKRDAVTEDSPADDTEDTPAEDTPAVILPQAGSPSPNQHDHHESDTHDDGDPDFVRMTSGDSSNAVILPQAGSPAPDQQPSPVPAQQPDESYSHEDGDPTDGRMPSGDSPNAVILPQAGSPSPNQHDHHESDTHDDGDPDFVRMTSGDSSSAVILPQAGSPSPDQQPSPVPAQQPDESYSHEDGDPADGRMTSGDTPSAVILPQAGSPAPDVLDPVPDRRRTDPIAVLAEAAGYEDPESWWSDLVEQNPAPGPIFDAVAMAMTEVRAPELDSPEPFEARREACMRLAIASCASAADGPVAVICGAWHVPALKAKHTKAEDKATLGALPRKKAQLTWAPWTSPRLSMAVGYGAGVAAPGWNKHLWETRGRTDSASVWLAQIARVLRDKGHLVSTASLIEAQRLAVALACIRTRPQPGFEELREACVACLFGGETLLWNIIEDELLLGNDVGEIPPNQPLAPLIEDFQAQSKAAKLKPEALERELSVDLRSQAGLFRSTLLHRLNLLGVPWGRLTNAGRSRGTFREKWILAYDPSYTVELVTKLIYGPTIEQAASGIVSEQFTNASTLTELADGIRDALTAALPVAVDNGLALLEKRAALSSDCEDILSTLPPLADILRYGQARAMDLASLGGLAGHLIQEAGINLMYAARGLDDDGAAHLCTLIEQADAGIRLIQPEPQILETWTNGLRAVLEDGQASQRVAGCVASILYESGDLDASDAVALVSLRLSPGTLVADAAGFLEGFFSLSSRRLIYDDGLRGAVDSWLTGLDDEDFMTYLPLMRRVLSNLDAMERKRLMAAVMGKRPHMPSGLVLAPDGGTGWARHLGVLEKILVGSEA